MAVSSGEYVARRARGAALPITRQAVGAVLLAYVATRAMICLVVYFSSLVIPVSGQASRGAVRLVLDGLTHWDSGIYLSIAAHGYQGQQSTAAFFPGYPLLISLISRVIHHPQIVGLLISNGAFLVALFYLYALARHEYGGDAAARTVLYLAAAPAAVFFSAVYTESLFVLLVVATFYYARAGAWGWAALTGLVAAATRNTGVVLAAVIALEGLHQGGLRWRPVSWQPRALRGHLAAQLRVVPGAWRSLRAAAVVPLGLLAYMAYLARVFGDPLAFAHAQRLWEKNNANAHVTHVLGALPNELGAGLLSGSGLHTGVVPLNALVTLAVVPLVIVVAYTMRPAYVVYTLVTFLVPLVAGHGVISMIRYVLMLVPCFMVLGYRGRTVWIDRLTLVFSLALMAYLSVTFSHNLQPV